MITCPKCQTLATPGASDCQKCGYAFSASESDPTYSPQKLYKWWLLFYAFWRVWILLSGGLQLSNAEQPIHVALLTISLVLAALSLSGIALLWMHKKVGLYFFVIGEVLITIMWLSVTMYEAVPHHIVALLVMYIVGRRANFMRK